jgi:NADH-quinone oxidoreductase subunit G
MATLNRLCRLRGWREPEFFETASLSGKVKNAVSRLDPNLAVSLREIEKADFILVAGCDPVNEAPMLALAMRQAFRNGAPVVVLDPRPVSLPFEFVHPPVPSGEIPQYASTLIKKGLERSAIAPLGEEALRFFDALPEKYPETGFQYRLPEIEAKFRNSRKPVLVCGTDIVPDSAPWLAADYALLLKEAKGWAGLFYVLPGPNAFGASLLSPEGGSLARIVEEIENGTVRALLIVENDPFWRFPDRQRLRRALARLECLVVMDYLPSAAAEMAGVFLPTATLFETESSWINQEGRLQFAHRFSMTGAPVEQVSGGGHPPRVFRPDIPGGEPRPAWRALADLEGAMDGRNQEPLEVSAKDVWTWMKEDHPWLGAVDPFRHPEGFRLAAGKKGARFSPDGPKSIAKIARESLELLDVDWIFGTEELSSYSPNLRELEKPPCIFMQSQDALRLGLRDKDRVRILLDGQALEFDLCAVPNMAEGTLVFPRHRQVEWQKLGIGPGKVPAENIKKV